MSADTSHDSEDFSEIEMDELDSYLTSPPAMVNDDDDDGARAAARARLAARAAHGEGGMAAQAAAEAAVEAVATGDATALSSLDANALSSLHARTPGASAKGMSRASRAPSNAEGAQKRKHIISPPMKVHRRKGDSGAPGVNVARAARDLCGDLGEPKESLMRRAVDVIGVVAANAIAIEVGAIEGAGGQMTTDGTRRRTPGGVFWALLKARAAKEDWDYIFEEEKEAARERCRRRRRAQSANGSPEGTPSGATLSGGGLLSGRFAAALSGLGVDASASATTAKTPFAVAGAAVVAGVDDAPARPSMAERLSGVSATAKAFTPAAKGAKVATPGSWAARAAAHTPAMRRARSAPAAALAAAAPAKNDDNADEDAFAVTTPDNDPAAANATPGGSYAARARAAAAAEAEAQAAAQVRARAAKIVAANAAAKKKLAPAPAVAVADDAAEAPAASFSAPAPAPAWGVSFASVLRAV